MRADLLALPEMSRIKLRVTAGVFEVSLVRVIEERTTVEVLWDGGVKKEFKWGSVVWGNTEGQNVGQKPSVPAPDGAPLPVFTRRDILRPITCFALCLCSPIKAEYHTTTNAKLQ